MEQPFVLNKKKAVAVVNLPHDRVDIVEVERAVRQRLSELVTATVWSVTWF
jgi:hypothetical protein